MATQTSARYLDIRNNMVIRGIALGILLWILTPPATGRSIAPLLLIVGIVLAVNATDWYQDAGRELAITGGTATLLALLGIGNLLEMLFGEVVIPY